MLKAKDLIQYGYFPSEIPPTFNTSSLGDNLDNLSLSVLERWNKVRKTNITESKCCLYSVPRVKNFRRILHIPNPFYQIILCDYIENNWVKIEAHLNQSSLSVSKPVLPIQRENHFSRSFDTIKDIINIEQEIAIKSTKYSYMLKTDISRYYSTIYTHSIPWALHTKDVAKTRRRDPTLFGNDIDKCVRNTKEGQTLGIPIGPDSSIILSEIIATSIDVELERNFKGIEGLRIIDDYILFFKERYECEEVLSKLNEILKSYELEMNPTKIQILEIPYILEPSWKSGIRHFHFRVPENPLSNIIYQKTDLINFFSRVNEFSLNFPNDNIQKYAVKRMITEKIYPDNIPLFESLLLKSALIQSSCIPQVILILLKNARINYSQKHERINQTISEIIRIHHKYSNDFEIAWALWLAKVLDLEIEKNIQNLLSRIDHPIIVLLTLDLRERGLITADIDETLWKSYLTGEQLYDDHWLLAYEAIQKGWLSSQRII